MCLFNILNDLRIKLKSSPVFVACGTILVLIYGYAQILIDLSEKFV